MIKESREIADADLGILDPAVTDEFLIPSLFDDEEVWSIAKDALDEVVADMIWQVPGARPSVTTVADLIAWSEGQTREPSGGGGDI